MWTLGPDQLGLALLSSHGHGSRRRHWAGRARAHQIEASLRGEPVLLDRCSSCNREWHQRSVSNNVKCCAPAAHRVEGSCHDLPGPSEAAKRATIVHLDAIILGGKATIRDRPVCEDLTKMATFLLLVVCRPTSSADGQTGQTGCTGHLVGLSHTHTAHATQNPGDLSSGSAAWGVSDARAFAASKSSCDHRSKLIRRPSTAIESPAMRI